MIYLVIPLGEGDPFAPATDDERDLAVTLGEVLAYRLGAWAPKMHVVDDAALCRRITGELAKQVGVKTPYA